MAIYRPIQISFWQDPFVVDLTPEEKYFYIYLMTNSKTSQCGIYEIAKRVIEMETGYSRDSGVIDKLISKFVDYNKILYNQKTKEVFLLNWLKYNPINNVNVEKRVLKELQEIKTKDYISIFIDKIKELDLNTPIISDAFEGLVRGYDTPRKKETPTPTPTPTSTSTPNNIVDYKVIIDYLNQKANTKYKATSKKTQDLIKARFNDKFTHDDFYKMIDKKCDEWIGTEWEKYLRPGTLFGNKFEEYLNQRVIKPKGKGRTTPVPDWMEEHQKYRESKQPIEEELPSDEELKELLQSFKE